MSASSVTPICSCRTDPPPVFRNFREQGCKPLKSSRKFARIQVHPHNTVRCLPDCRLQPLADPDPYVYT